MRMEDSIERIEFRVRVLFRHEITGERETAWVAQCIDYDIAAQGRDIPEAKAAFEKTFVGQIIVDLDAGRRPLEAIPPAPREDAEAFERATRLSSREVSDFHLPPNVPPAYMIRAIADDLRVSS